MLTENPSTGSIEQDIERARRLAEVRLSNASARATASMRSVATEEIKRDLLVARARHFIVLERRVTEERELERLLDQTFAQPSHKQTRRT